MEELLSFYTDVWHGLAEENERETVLSRAADIIDGEIFLSGVTVGTVGTAGEALKTAVYKAVCAQADCIAVNGGAAALYETRGGSVSLGSFSYSDGAGAASGSGNTPDRLCSAARSYLLPTGLLYKGL